jgi:dolichyl-phosphate beta-glucosyltransferase
MNVTLIIPAFNEAAVIRDTINEAFAYFDARGTALEVIVSADGTDGTREVARALAVSGRSIQVIGEPLRRGKGRGVREAAALATGEVVGFADADNKTPITEFDKIERALFDGNDVVIGSRGLPQSRIDRPQPFYRRLGSWGFGIFMHACVGLDDIIDTQCGFKFFRSNVARDLFAAQRIDGYMFDIEILYLARRRGYKIAQVPVRWRDDGDSRLQLISGNIRNVRDVLSVRRQHRSARLAALPVGLEVAEAETPSKQEPF